MADLRADQERSSTSDKPTLGKRWLFQAVIFLTSLCLLELLSLVVLWGQGLRGAGDWRRDRERVMRPAAVGATSSDSARPPTGGGQVIHPFVGFVQDRDSPENTWELTEDGFPSIPNDPPEGSTEGAFVVGIFGGSVAHGLCTAGRASLLRELR
jgi:hypothetical protein